MRQWGVNNLPKVVAQQRHGRGSNPRSLDRKSATPYRLATAPPNSVALFKQELSYSKQIARKLYSIQDEV